MYILSQTSIIFKLIFKLIAVIEEERRELRDCFINELLHPLILQTVHSLHRSHQCCHLETGNQHLTATCICKLIIMFHDSCFIVHCISCYFSCFSEFHNSYKPKYTQLASLFTTNIHSNRPLPVCIFSSCPQSVIFLPRFTSTANLSSASPPSNSSTSFFLSLSFNLSFFITCKTSSAAPHKTSRG